MAVRNTSTTDMVLKTKEEMHQEYLGRANFAKEGQKAYGRKEYPEAIKQYNKYLAVVAREKGSKPFELTISMFGKDDMAEMMILSHIYWDLAKIYDQSPSLEESFHKSLDQFVKFSAKQTYHPINSSLIRKYIKKGAMKNRSAFEKAYKQIYSSSNKCYVATYCYGEDHPITEDLRRFRNKIIDSTWGAKFVNGYYRFSPGLIDFCQRHPVPGKFLGTFFFRPIVYIMAKLVSL